jgi:sec-independent protein translocase protein TatC
MTLIQHLEELRRRLIFALLAVAAGAVIGWFLYDPVIELLRDPYCTALNQLPKSNRPPTGCDFVFNGAVDPILIKLKVVVFLGLAIALPVVLYQLWAFIVPGLTRRERRFAIPFIVSATVLFAAGIVLAYVTMPKALSFLLGFAGDDFVPLLTGDRFISFMILVSLAFGISFEFPVLLVFLAQVGIISSRTMREWRRWAILGISVFAAVITPSADPYTMIALMIPMIGLYEVAILITRLTNK